jgi:HSP20 family protein
MLMRFEPLRDLDRPAEQVLNERRARYLPVDAYRRGDELKIELDLPGADPGSIELTVENEVLSVRATRTSAREEADEVEIAERGHGQMGRQLVLAQNLDSDHATAVYRDGVLTLTIPVAQQVKPRKIDVTHVGSVAQAVEAATVSV